MKKYDLIVVGGGFAGVTAALESARHGVDVLLVEKYNFLGGAAANCLITPYMPYWSNDPESDERMYLTGDMFLKIADEMLKIGGMRDMGLAFDEEILKLVLNRMCAEYGVDLLYDTVVTDVKVEGSKIVSLEALGKSKKLELVADNYIDATGDGELAYLAGCEYMLGREEDNLCQPMTLCFRMSGVDIDKYLKNHKRMSEIYKEFKEKGLIKNPREDILSFRHFDDDVVHFNTTRIVKTNPTDPFEVTRAEIEAREQVFEMHHFLKNNIEGFENARIQSTALQIGIRESRKIVGEHILNVEELKSLARFDDAIAVANYDIDIHNPSGAGTSHYFFGKGEWYEIPYRSLIPKGKDNLLIAGRCISSTHEAQASYRIMPFCAQLGQAAGAAMSLAKKQGVSPKGIDIKALQKILKEEKFYIH